MSAQGRCVVHSATIRGVEALAVEVEVSISNGIPGFSIVGMADASVQESRERVKSALRACGFTMPASKVVINLAPSSLRKTGSGFDLPIAVGILCATGQIDYNETKNYLYVGELSLEGFVRPVAGLLAYALRAKKMGRGLVSALSEELLVVDGVDKRALPWLGNIRTLPLSEIKGHPQKEETFTLDFKDIAGHRMAKRALQIAAAGNHGVLMMGPPGSGKTMLASRLPSILPSLTKEEALETAVIHSVAGESVASILGGVRPFRKPHHSATSAGLIGGGSPLRPGEISLSHNGVLFLDELAEFSPSVLQGIRQPLEAGKVTLTRADGHVDFPAKFMFVAASNPCACGYFGDAEEPCSCTPRQINMYQGRIGGPVLDRIDLHIDISRVPPGEVLATGEGTSSASLREGVLKAREYASWRRSKDAPISKKTPSEALVKSCSLTQDDEEFLKDAAQLSHMSGRAIMRTLALARTIADMEESSHVSKAHLCEAIGLRLREGGV